MWTEESRLSVQSANFAKLNAVVICKATILHFLGAFAKLRKTTIRFVMSVRPSVRLSVWNNSAATGPILMKFDI
jgi:hypothetical protein